VPKVCRNAMFFEPLGLAFERKAHFPSYCKHSRSELVVGAVNHWLLSVVDRHVSVEGHSVGNNRAAGLRTSNLTRCSISTNFPFLERMTLFGFGFFEAASKSGNQYSTATFRRGQLRGQSMTKGRALYHRSNVAR
jgi:hypothetical protein